MFPVEQHKPHRLDRSECLRLLAVEDVGRLGLVQGQAPVIFPVNYAWDGQAIVFRTAEGTKLSHGPRSAVAFEIDGLDRENRSGWSVLVTGRLDEVTEADPDLWGRVQDLGIRPWEPGTKGHWMRLVPGIITGRWVGPEA